MGERGSWGGACGGASWEGRGRRGFAVVDVVGVFVIEVDDVLEVDIACCTGEDNAGPLSGVVDVLESGLVLDGENDETEAFVAVVVAEDVEVRGVENTVEAVDVDRTTSCWLAPMPTTPSDDTACITPAGCAPHHRSLLLIQCASPSFQLISSQTSFLLLRFRAERFASRTAPTLSGPWNLYAALFVWSDFFALVMTLIRLPS